MKLLKFVMFVFGLLVIVVATEGVVDDLAASAQIRHPNEAPTIYTGCPSVYVQLPAIYETGSCFQASTEQNTFDIKMQWNTITASRSTPTYATSVSTCTDGQITHPPTYTKIDCKYSTPGSFDGPSSCTSYVESLPFEHDIPRCILLITPKTRSQRWITQYARRTAITTSQIGIPCGELVPCPGSTTLLGPNQDFTSTKKLSNTQAGHRSTPMSHHTCREGVGMCRPQLSSAQMIPYPIETTTLSPTSVRVIPHPIDTTNLSPTASSLHPCREGVGLCRPDPKSPHIVWSLMVPIPTTMQTVGKH